MANWAAKPSRTAVVTGPAVPILEAREREEEALDGSDEDGLEQESHAEDEGGDEESSGRDLQASGAGCCQFCASGMPTCQPCEVSLTFGDKGAEKLTAQLEQRATAEAEMLVGADGAICRERLALLGATFNAAFVQRVLSRTPFPALALLPKDTWDADAMNTALLLDDFREIRQWQEASATTSNLFPMRLCSVFDGSESLAARLEFYGSLVPKPFQQAHPHISMSQGLNGAKEGLVDQREFLSLLRSFSRGILEDLPLHPRSLILGGGAMPWCMRQLNEQQRELCRLEMSATAFEAELHATLAARLGWACASRIAFLACGVGTETSGGGKAAKRGAGPSGPPAPRRSAAELRQAICKEFGNEAWADADIDLFVLAENAEETVRHTIAVLQRNIDAVAGGRESVVLRTKNTLTVVGGFPLPIVQVVCKTVRSCQELLVHSDVDCSALAYDGEQVWAAKRALRALASGFNFIPKQVLTGFGPRPERSAARFAKYLRRGFGLLVFEHCRHVPRCDASVPPDSLDRLKRMKAPKEPANLKGSPAEKGRALAQWMLKRAPELRRGSPKEAEADDGGQDRGPGGSLGEDADILDHRVVPGDRLGSAGDGYTKGAGKGRGRGDSSKGGGGGGRGAPFLRSYGGFNDLVIPCGPGVCAGTLREYVGRIGRPDLMQEVVGVDVAIEPKKKSDRQQWQDKARGKCYMCKTAMKTREPWPLCEECAAFERRKREETADCRGMVAVVTGGRTKIGRECALRLLRLGATVVITTRFPRCALERYRAENDFEEFEGRLIVLGADFRKLTSVHRVVEEVLRKFDRLDILVHNAAQTVRRPQAYFESLLRHEEELAQLADKGPDPDAEAASSADDGKRLVETALALLPEAAGLPLLPEDEEAEVRKAEWFPPGLTDAHGEQLDLRAVTSWTQRLEDTSMPELAEVLAVNLVVPYLLTARWLPLLRAAPAAFVVFVTSQEGSFSPPSDQKNSTHPHTNVAKAGLNMLMRTVAGELRRDSIFAMAVDPGWVSWMKPGGSQAAEAAPLTEADGAARVLDPVISGLKALRESRVPPSGVLYKDFRVAPW